MSQLFESVHYAYQSKNLPSGLTCTDRVQFQKKIPEISHCGSRSPKYIELGHFTLLFFRGWQRNVPKRTSTAIVLLSRPFVWCRSRRRRRRRRPPGLLRLPNVKMNECCPEHSVSLGTHLHLTQTDFQSQKIIWAIFKAR